MNASSTIAADRSTSIKRVADRVEASLDAHALTNRLLAGLDLIPAITNDACTLSDAKRIARRVRWFAGNGNAGMLGANGMQPQVEALIRSANFHGFKPRTPEALTSAVFAAAGGR